MSIGITGPMGSGKSTAAKFFSQKGLALVDMDQVGIDLLNDPGIQAALTNAFGTDIIEDGRIDRARTANRAFADTKSIATLNRIMHPVMKERILDRIREHRHTGVVVDGALIFEMGIDIVLDTVVLITASLETRSERMQIKRGWGREEIEKRERFQMNLNEKEKRSDFVIRNDSTIYEFNNQLESIWRIVNNG